MNPTCAPGDTNCSVSTPATGFKGDNTFVSLATSTTQVGIGATSSLAKLYIQSTSVATSTLYLQGLAGQTADLFQVASSSGQILFEILQGGIASSSNFSFVNASGTRLDLTTGGSLGAITFSTASSSLNVTIGGTLQSNAGQSTFASVSSTNLFGSGYLNFVSGRADLQVVSSTSNMTVGGSFQSNAGQTTLGSVSSTNVFANGYLTIQGGAGIPDLLRVASSSGRIHFQVSGGGVASSTEFRSPSSTIGTLTVTTCTGCGLSGQTDTAVIIGNAAGSGTSTLLLTVVTSTGVMTFSGSNFSVAGAGTSTSLVFLQGGGSATASTTLNIFGSAAQTASLFSVASNTGLPLFNINALGQVAIGTSTYPASSTLFTVATSSNIFTVLSNGMVGIGTSTPSAQLSVSGQLYSGTFKAGNVSTINWNNANLQTVSSTPGAITFSNMQDGGSYTLITTNNASGTYTFSQTGLTFKFVPANASTTGGKDTVYTFLRAGINVYVSWTPGF